MLNAVQHCLCRFMNGLCGADGYGLLLKSSHHSEKKEMEFGG